MSAMAAQAIVVSVIPGRLRLRLTGRWRAAEELRRVTEALQELTGVSEAKASERTGSVIVRFEPEAVGPDDLAASLSRLGLELGPATSTAPQSGPGRVATGARALDGFVQRGTGGLELRLLVPVGLGLLAARQALTAGQELRRAPWYVLGWYAFDSFLKLNDAPAAGRRPARRRSATGGGADG
jgi:copper chaperone CopZ